MTEWGYEGDIGPEHWADLDVAFALARVGIRQSPIDLSSAIPGDAGRLDVDYAAARVTGLHHQGHTLEMLMTSGARINLARRTFDLVEAHFHAPSEHTLAGEPYAMEIHLVHVGVLNEVAVIGVFIREGAHHPELARLFASIPRAGQSRSLIGGDVELTALLPADTAHRFSYSGSLTTPPCSQGVRWTVFADPIEVSVDDLAVYANAFSPNVRPVQPLNGRPVVKSNG